LLSFALGTASGTNPGLTAGDTLWISPGTYRDASGFTYNGNPGTSGNPVNIYGDPTFTRAWSAGTAGPVRITTASSDTSIAPVNTSALTLNKEYITVQDLCLDSSPPNSLGFGLTGVLSIGSSAGNITVTRCVIQTEQANSSNRFFCIGCNIGNGKTNFTFDKCVLLLGGAIYSGINTQSSTPHNVNVVVKDGFAVKVDVPDSRQANYVGQNNRVSGSVDACGQHRRSWAYLAVQTLIPDLNGSGLGNFVGDRSVGGHADACNCQIRLGGGYVCVGSDHMIQQIYRVCGNCVGVQPLFKNNGALLERPHVDATVCPVSKQ